MRYYDFDREEQEPTQEIETFFEGKTEEDRYMEMVQTNLSANEVNQNTLAIAVDVLEKSFLWRFRSAKAKMQMVSLAYRQLKELI